MKTVTAKLRWAAAAVAMLALAACQHAGPTSIEMGRADYNSAIQQTSQQQLLANIVRVRQAQMPLVMDVTQINAGLTFQTSVTGAASGIGGEAALQGAGPSTPTSATAGALKSLVVPTAVGTVGGTMIYTETPTITYTPLTGQPLIAQLATPITVDFLAALPDSQWPMTSVLRFAVNYAAPDYENTSAALNGLSALDNIGSLTTSAGRSSLSSGDSPDVVAQSSKGGGQAAGPGSPTNDTLTFYVLPGNKSDVATNERMLRLWIRVLRIYWPVESQADTAAYAAHMRDLSQVIAALDASDKRSDGRVEYGGASYDMGDFLQDQFRQLPGWVELRTSPILPGLAARCNTPLDPTDLQPPPGATCFTLSPIMRTRSALGVLKAAVERPEPLIEFVSPAVFQRIRAESWNSLATWGAPPAFYTLLPSDEDSVDCPVGPCDQSSDDPDMRSFFDCYIRQVTDPIDLFTINPAPKCPKPQKGFSPELEHRLSTARRFLLIVESEQPPGEALPSTPIFTAWHYRGRWYWIADDDEATKRNFALLSELLTIMAIPTQSSAPAPTLSVGGRGG